MFGVIKATFLFSITLTIILMIVFTPVQFISIIAIAFVLMINIIDIVLSVAMISVFTVLHVFWSFFNVLMYHLLHINIARDFFLDMQSDFIVAFQSWLDSVRIFMVEIFNISASVVNLELEITASSDISVNISEIAQNIEDSFVIIVDTTQELLENGKEWLFGK